MQEISELHKAARRYAEAGIPVFPVEVGGKKPVTPNGFYDATTDLQKIELWWCDKDYNVAFSPGMVGLLVVDVDPAGISEYEHFKKPTYTVKTPRGFHYYFSGSGPTTASKILLHVDTRGEGGYVLAPPSVVAGKSYQVIDDQDYAPIPEWISEALKKPEVKLTAATEEKDLPINIGRVKELLTKYVDEGKVAIEGQGGDDLTYRVCCEVLDFGLSPQTAFELLNEIWNVACVPPWDSGQLAEKIQNAASYQQNEPGCKALEPTEKVFGATLAKLFPVKRSRFYFKDEEEQENEPEPQWVIKDLISERSTVLFYGPTQSYKSFLALDIALGVATGHETFGSNPKAGPVFYAALEGRAHLRKARRSWKIARGVEGRLKAFYVGLAPMVGIPGECAEFINEIEKRCGNEKPKIIIIDTLSKAMAGLNENDAKEAGQFIRFCDFLVETFGCSVIAIHHAGKDASRGARGSSAFHAGFDTVIEVAASRDTKAVSVKVQKQKDAEERETPWTFEGRLVGGSLAFFPTTPKEHHLLTNSEAEFSPRKIGAALQKLKAYGIDHAVTASVLAETLTVRQETQSEENYQEVLGKTIQILTKNAKDTLAPYTVRAGRELHWTLPAQ